MHTQQKTHKIASANPNGQLTVMDPQLKPQVYDHVDRIQKYGTVRYQRLESRPLNKAQQRLYSRTVYGLNYFTDQQLAKLPESERHRITQTYQKVQKILNRWKQQVISKQVDDLLLALFYHSSFVKQFVSRPCVDDEYIDSHSFKELGISQTMIAKKLIQSKLLPDNFFQLA